MIVKTRAWLVPPLVQPKEPEFPLGVCTCTFAVPGAEMAVVVIVIFNCVLLMTEVLCATPLINPTDAETN